MHKPELKIVHDDFVGASQNLKAVARGFRDNAQTVEDIRCALGHDRLADRLGDFADSWRIKREKMQGAFEALAAEIQRQLDDWTKLDLGLSGGGEMSPDDTRKEAPDGGGPGQQPAPGRPERPGPTPSPRAEPAPSLPSPVPSPTVESPPTAPAPLPEPIVGSEPPLAPLPPDMITANLLPKSIEIMVDENEDTFRAIIPAAAAGGGIAALLSLFRIWQGQRPSPADRAPSDVPTPGGGSLTPEQRLVAEFERMRGEGQAVDVSLIRDPMDPGDVLAILRGADGAESVIDVNPEDGAQAGPGMEAVVGDPLVDPAAEHSVAPPPDESASPTGSPVADTAAPLAPAAGLSDGGAAPVAPGKDGADPSPPLEAPASFGASPSVGTPWSTSAQGEPPISDSSAQDGEGAQPHAVAGATAGMGMMGMGAANAAQATSGGAAGTRLKQDDLKRPHEQDARRKDGDQ